VIFWRSCLRGCLSTSVIVGALRVVALAAVAVAGLLVSSAGPAAERAAVYPYRTATWTIDLNGPLTPQVVRGADGLLPSGSHAVLEYHGFIQKVTSGGVVLPDAGAVFYRRADVAGVGDGLFTSGMLREGGVTPSAPVGIDALSARRLGVGLGDRVTYASTLPTPDGKTVTLSGEGVVGALYEPANDVSGLLLPLSGTVARLLTARGTLGTDMLIVTGEDDAEALAARLNARYGRAGFTAVTARAQMVTAREATRQLIRVRVAPWLALALLLTWTAAAVWLAARRMAARGADTTAQSLVSMAPRRPLAMGLVEMAGATAAAALIAYAAARLVVGSITIAYIAPELLDPGLLLLAGGVAVVALVTVLYWIRQTRVESVCLLLVTDEGTAS
jgi:hypothetical protein